MVGRANYGNYGHRSHVSFSLAATHISLPRRPVVEIGAVRTQLSKHTVPFNPVVFLSYVCFTKRTYVADTSLVKFCTV